MAKNFIDESRLDNDLTIDDLVNDAIISPMAEAQLETEPEPETQVTPSDVDKLIIKQLIESEKFERLIDYCALLPLAAKAFVEELLQHDEQLLKLAKKLKFKSDKLSTKVRADLAAWGYHDIRLNQLDDTIEINGERVTDNHESRINMIARDAGYGGKVRPLAAIQDVIRVMATENNYHPIRDYLNDLKWDGQDHISKLSHYVTDEHEPIVYANGSKCSVFPAFFGRWLIGSIGKIFSTGAVRVQNPMLVLTGGQGLGKSTFIEWLCPLPQFFISSSINPDSAEHQRFLATKWIWEACELGSTTRRADREALKAFLTQQELNFRIPYAKHPIQRPAITSFIGTLNPEDGYLNDPTGNRRFTTVELKSIDFRYSREIDPNQLWAQAMNVYRDNPQAWWYTPEEQTMRSAINQDHKSEMPFESQLLDIFEFGPECAGKYTNSDILNELHKTFDIATTISNQKLLGVTLKALGCERKSIKKDGRTIKGYTGLSKKL